MADELTVVIVAAGSIAAAVAFAAGLLVVAERLLSSYGVRRIVIDGEERSIITAGGKPLLAALQDDGLHVPTACDGEGGCGTCKVKVNKGGGPVMPVEKTLLSEDDLHAGYRLACRVPVRRNMKIELPRPLVTSKQFRGRVAAIDELSHDARLIRIELLEPGEMDFSAGQRIRLRIPKYERMPGPVHRTYWIASAPEQKESIEIIARRVPGGTASTWIYNSLKVGNEVRFFGPYGEFGLSDADCGMFWFAMGVGAVASRSMALHMKNAGIKRKCTCAVATAIAGDLFLMKEFRQLDEEIPDFHFVPCLLSLDVPEDWDGETGSLTDVAKRIVRDSVGAEAYLAGPPSMVAEVTDILLKKGMSPEDIIHQESGV